MSRRPVGERFASLISRFKTLHPIHGYCWDWLGAKVGGYGVLTVKGKPTKAHRLSWESFYGVIPEGMYVLHKCDNPACANPDHLFLGTNDDNMADMVSKGRQCRGEGQHSARLTEDQVREIRLVYQRRSRVYGVTALSRRYKVPVQIIVRVVKGETWRHVNEV
jgi:hypothetical protein